MKWHAKLAFVVLFILAFQIPEHAGALSIFKNLASMLSSKVNNLYTSLSRRMHRSYYSVKYSMQNAWTNTKAKAYKLWSNTKNNIIIKMTVFRIKVAKLWKRFFGCLKDIADDIDL